MLFLFPVKENMGSGTGSGTLMPTCPASTFFWKYEAETPDVVKIQAPLPYSFELRSWTASSSVRTEIQTKTGPNISSL
jgi:hypothetical protein